MEHLPAETASFESCVLGWPPYF